MYGGDNYSDAEGLSIGAVHIPGNELFESHREVSAAAAEAKKNAKKTIGSSLFVERRKLV